MIVPTSPLHRGVGWRRYQRWVWSASWGYKAWAAGRDVRRRGTHPQCRHDRQSSHARCSQTTTRGSRRDPGTGRAGRLLLDRERPPGGFESLNFPHTAVERALTRRRVSQPFPRLAERWWPASLHQTPCRLCIPSSLRPEYAPSPHPYGCLWLVNGRAGHRPGSHARHLHRRSAASPAGGVAGRYWPAAPGNARSLPGRLPPPPV